MAKCTTPITVFVKDAAEACNREAHNQANSRALTTDPGTLKFHALIAQHGAGEFKTLYVPLELAGQTRLPRLFSRLPKRMAECFEASTPALALASACLKAHGEARHESR